MKFKFVDKTIKVWRFLLTPKKNKIVVLFVVVDTVYSCKLAVVPELLENGSAVVLIGKERTGVAGVKILQPFALCASPSSIAAFEFGKVHPGASLYHELRVSASVARL